MRNAPHRLLIGLLGLAGLLIAAPSASAGECDLYSTTSYCLFQDSALFQMYGPHPTGTGVIDSFLRVQQNGSEQAFNTSYRQNGLPDKGIICDAGPVYCDAKIDQAAYTENLLTSDVPIVTINGVQYRQFFLDINEPASLTGEKNLLTLDQIEIFQSDAGSLSQHTSAGGGGLVGAAKIWDMDPAIYSTSNVAALGTNGLVSQSPCSTCGSGKNGAADNWINLDYVLVGGGSGWGDMVMYIPNSFFDASTKYVYLYSQFGCTTDCGQTKYNSIATNQYPSQAGFEEWWIKRPSGGSNDGSSPVPEPGTLALVATGLAAAVRSRRKAGARR